MKFHHAAVLVATLAVAAPAPAALKVGTAAPDFSAQAYLAGKPFTFRLSDALKQGPVVVYFFPAATSKRTCFRRPSTTSRPSTPPSSA